MNKNHTLWLVSFYGLLVSVVLFVAFDIGKIIFLPMVLFGIGILGAMMSEIIDATKNLNKIITYLKNRGNNGLG